MAVNGEGGGGVGPGIFFDHINNSRDMGHPSWPDHLSRLHVLEQAPQVVAIFHFHLLTTWPCAFPGSSGWALIQYELLVCTHLQALLWCTGCWQQSAGSIPHTASEMSIYSTKDIRERRRKASNYGRQTTWCIRSWILFRLLYLFHQNCSNVMKFRFYKSFFFFLLSAVIAPLIYWCYPFIYLN